MSYAIKFKNRAKVRTKFQSGNTGFTDGLLYFNIDYVLGLWLGEYPAYTPAFLRVLLWSLLISSLSQPLYNALEAQGNISRYQISAAIIQPMLIVYSYIVLSYGCSPVFAISSHVILTAILQIILLYQLIKYGIINYKELFFKVYYRSLFVVLLGVLFCSINIKQGFLAISVDILIATSIIIIVGLNRCERQMLLRYISNIKRNDR